MARRRSKAAATKAGRTRAAAQARREKAAILIASGLPVKQIAELLEVKEGTVRDLACEPAVRAMIDAERIRQAARLRGSVDRALDELRSAAPKAARRLAHIAVSGSQRNATRAAVAILDRVIAKPGTAQRGRGGAAVDLSDATDEELWAEFNEARAARERDQELAAKGAQLLAADAEQDVIDGELDDDDA